MKNLLFILSILFSLNCYSNEQIENKTAQHQVVNNEDDWEKVLVVFEEKDVAGLADVGEVIGESKWGAAASVKGGKKAIEKMKREAAKNGCSIVLITAGWDKNKSKPISGYNRGVKLTGHMYKIKST